LRRVVFLVLALASVFGEPARAADLAADRTTLVAAAEPQPELAFRAGSDFAAWQQVSAEAVASSGRRPTFR